MAAAVLGVLLLGGPALAAEAIHLTTGMREPWTTAERSGFTDLLVRELFRRLGRDGTVEFNGASARALSLADLGTDDGLAARVAGLDKEYPNLIRVPEKIFDNDFVAGSEGPAVATDRWEAMAPFSVAYIIGWQIFEHNLPKVRELTMAKDSRQLLTLLKSGKVEMVLHERWQLLWHARALGMQVRIHEPPLARVPMYLYLNRRHAELIAPISRELAAMKADGTYDRLAAQAFAGLGGGRTPLFH
ncbi:MAG: substrate-binding periplasmic protein [Actinomycetota bacterium]